MKYARSRKVHRREFLVEGTVAASAAALLAGCGDDEGDDGPTPVTIGARVVDLEDAKSVGAKGALDAAREEARRAEFDDFPFPATSGTFEAQKTYFAQAANLRR